MKGRRLVLLAVVSLGFAIPARMTYQGKITDPSGVETRVTTISVEMAIPVPPAAMALPVPCLLNGS